jgi:hypothetical protein
VYLCGNCGKNAVKRCSQCHQVYYCSISCQQEHWMGGGHKGVCIVRSTMDKPDEASARAAPTAETPGAFARVLLAGAGTHEPIRCVRREILACSSLPAAHNTPGQITMPAPIKVVLVSDTEPAWSKGIAEHRWSYKDVESKLCNTPGIEVWKTRLAKVLRCEPDALSSGATKTILFVRNPTGEHQHILRKLVVAWNEWPGALSLIPVFQDEAALDHMKEAERERGEVYRLSHFHGFFARQSDTIRGWLSSVNSRQSVFCEQGWSALRAMMRQRCAHTPSHISAHTSIRTR